VIRKTSPGPWAGSPITRARGIYAKLHSGSFSERKIAVFWQNDDAGKDPVQGLKDGLGAKASMIIADKSYEVSEPHHRFPDRPPCTIRAPTSSSPGQHRRIGAGDPEGRRTRLETEILPRQHRNLGRLRSQARRPRNAQGIISTAYLKDPTDPTWKDDPAPRSGLHSWTNIIRMATRPMQQRLWLCHGADDVQVLKQCGDNLTPRNVMKQAASLKNFLNRHDAARESWSTPGRRFLSDRADAVDEIRGRELAFVRRCHHPEKSAI